jgi:hypothetical protein
MSRTSRSYKVYRPPRATTIGDGFEIGTALGSHGLGGSGPDGGFPMQPVTGLGFLRHPTIGCCPVGQCRPLLFINELSPAPLVLRLE